MKPSWPESTIVLKIATSTEKGSELKKANNQKLLRVNPNKWKSLKYPYVENKEEFCVYPSPFSPPPLFFFFFMVRENAVGRLRLIIKGIAVLSSIPVIL